MSYHTRVLPSMLARAERIKNTDPEEVRKHPKQNKVAACALMAIPMITVVFAAVGAGVGGAVGGVVGAAIGAGAGVGAAAIIALGVSAVALTIFAKNKRESNHIKERNRRLDIDKERAEILLEERDKRISAKKLMLHNTEGIDFTKIPGIGLSHAYELSTLINPNVDQFETANHFAQWLGLQVPDGVERLAVERRQNLIPRNIFMRAAKQFTYDQFYQGMGGFLHRLPIKTRYKNFAEYAYKLSSEIGRRKAHKIISYELAKILFYVIKSEQGGENRISVRQIEAYYLTKIH